MRSILSLMYVDLRICHYRNDVSRELYTVQPPTDLSTSTVVCSKPSWIYWNSAIKQLACKVKWTLSDNIWKRTP
jgi:hypothetical protein